MKIKDESDVGAIFKKVFGTKNVDRFVPGKYSPNGVADFSVLVNRIDHWIEVKINKTTLTKPQKHFLKKRVKAMVLHIDTKKKLVTLFSNGYLPKIFDDLPGAFGADWDYIHLNIKSILDD